MKHLCKPSERRRLASVLLGIVVPLAILMATAEASALAQDKGRITGVVRNAAGTAVAGVTVEATNQVNSQVKRAQTATDGSYSLQLSNGAYRLAVAAPHSAKFEKGKDYGPFIIVRDDVLENVIVEPGKNLAIDIVLEEKKPEALPKVPSDQPIGYTGKDSVQLFMVLSGVSTTTVQQVRAPTPSDVSSDEPSSAEFFGQPEQLAANQILQLTFELFHGDTTFRPRDWAIKISPTFSIPNYVNARENGVVNIDVRRGTNRTDSQVSLEEAFAEVKLTNVNENYDFVSVRAGIQPFVSDFRGFIFSDNNLGARLFGAFDNNRYQFNAAYFSMLEKDTNSGLNRFDTRHQNVYIANLFRQDFITKGYTIQANLHYNDDRTSIKFDRNNFPVRPALIGDARPHNIKVGYLGINGDGHLGKINLTNSYYYAFGRDSFNPIAGRKVRVKAQMAAVEASMDRDYLRFKGSFFWAQGDANPTDDKGTGFDAIFDDPNFVGGQFSFFNRNGIRLTQTGVGLVQGNSILPSLRSSKIQGQSNFVNPGIFIYNAGVDAEITQRIKAIFNVNYLRFHRTESLEYVLFQNRIRHDIGFDYSVGVLYRPFLINNVQITFGASTLQTGRGFRDIFTNRSRNCPPNVGDFCEPDVISPRKPLYSLFAQLKLIF